MLQYDIQWKPSCEATPFASEKWPFKRGGLLSGVEINTFMFRFSLSSGLSRGSDLSSRWPLKRGSTVFRIVSLENYKNILIFYSKCLFSLHAIFFYQNTIDIWCVKWHKWCHLVCIQVIQSRTTRHTGFILRSVIRCATCGGTIW